MVAKKKTRSVVRTVKLTNDEEKAIASAAARAGVSFSEYMREAVLARAAPELSASSRLNAIGGAT